jgi:hypothetical protein
MQPSRIALAAVIALRAVLIYGEATDAASAELGWRELLPARWRVRRPRLATGAAAPARAITGPSA